MAISECMCTYVLFVCYADIAAHSSAARRSATEKTAIADESVVLNCHFDFPDDRWVEHMISWRKEGIEVPVFIQINGHARHVDADYDGRIRLLQQASIQLSDVRRADAGYYECSVTFLEDEASSPNATWIHLTVHCEC